MSRNNHEHRLVNQSIHGQTRTRFIIRIGFRFLLLFVGVNLIDGGFGKVSAHEGHKPLPSKGVEVDVKKGSILLTKSARDTLGLETGEVVLQSGEQRVLAYAKLVTPWRRHAVVTTQVPGKVVKLYVQPGDWVKAGQPLADIDSPILENLQLDLLNARDAAKLSEKLEKHFQSINQDFVAGKQLQEAMAKHLENVNALQMARFKLLNIGFTERILDGLLESSQPQLSHTLTLVSMIDGRVNHTDLSVGRIVQTSEHLFEVFDPTQLWCQIDILERDLNRITVGQKVEISLSSLAEQIFQGEINLKDPYLDPVTHLGRAWLDVDNPADGSNQLLPGMFGQAQVIVASPDKLLTVPATAVARDGAERFVLVQEEVTDKASQFVKRNIVVVQQTENFVQFRSDKVFPGDRVVTVGAHELFNFFVQGVLRVSKEAAETIGLRIQPVSEQVIDFGFSIDGLVELPAELRDRVSSPLAGRIESILIDRGQRVKAGDVVAQLSSLEFQDLQLQLISTDLELKNIEVTLGRLKKFGELPIVAQRELWETESAFQQAQNRRDNLQRKLITFGVAEEQIRQLINDKTIMRSIPLRATIDGSVAYFDKVLGQTVEAGQTIVEIHNPSRAWVHAFVSEQESSRIKIGQNARVRLVALPNQFFEAVVVRSGQSLDQANRTLSVWLELKGDLQTVIQHNLMARIEIFTESSPLLLAIDRGAFVNESNRHYVFVMTSDGKFDRRLVTIGRSNDRMIEIKSGLQAGEQVAVWGSADLQSAFAALR